MDEHVDTDDLRLDALTASAGAGHIGFAVRAQGLDLAAYVNHTPDQALTIDSDRIEF